MQWNRLLKDGFLFQALSYIRDTLVLTESSGHVLSRFPLELESQQLFDRQVDFGSSNIFFKLVNGELSSKPDDELAGILDRPAKIFDGFDWNSSFGLYIKGIKKARQRDCSEARIYIEHCIEADRSFIPAYTSLAELDIRQLRYSEAREKLLLALGFDTYDPDANFLYGTLLEKYGEYLKAKDAYGITLTSQKYRMASLNRLALVALKEKKYYCT